MFSLLLDNKLKLKNLMPYLERRALLFTALEYSVKTDRKISLPTKAREDVKRGMGRKLQDRETAQDGEPVLYRNISDNNKDESSASLPVDHINTLDRISNLGQNRQHILKTLSTWSIILISFKQD